MEEVNGFDYEERGIGEAVLLIHGGIISDAFAPLLREEALDGYRLIRHRRRGFGTSPGVSPRPSFEEHAADARALLEHLDAAPAHVVGYSASGPIALQLAVDAPHLVRSLVLIEPALQTAAMAASFDELVAPLVAMHRAGERAKAVHLFMKVATNPRWRTEVEAAIPGAVQRAEDDSAGTFEGDLAAVRDWDFDDVRDRIDRPVLHVVGSITAPRVEPATALLRDAVPGREHVVIDGADHALPWTHAGPLAEVIADYLRRHRDRGSTVSSRSATRA